MTQQAIVLAVVAMLGWGVWTVLANQATQSIDPEIAMILSYATGVVVALGYVAAQNEPLQFDRIGVGLALAAGVFAGIGAVAFYAGLSAGGEHRHDDLGVVLRRHGRAGRRRPRRIAGV